MAIVETPAARDAETAVIPSVRLADYLELTKPRIAAMALLTVAVGYLLGSPVELRLDFLVHAILGAGFVAAGGSVLNHWWERRVDGLMLRTANRPLPAGRLPAAEAFALGISLAVGGVAYLAFTLPNPAAAITAAITCLLYVAVYTPLKRITCWNTVIGAIPGALPPVIGWAAVTGGIGWGALALFAILFVWQLPHFYSIAWLHREDYARGGMRMLPVVDSRDGPWTGRATVASCLVLLLVTAAPYVAGLVGGLYLVASLPLAIWFLIRAIDFAQSPNLLTARKVLRGSLIYLTGVMVVLVIDGVLPRYL